MKKKSPEPYLVPLNNSISLNNSTKEKIESHSNEGSEVERIMFNSLNGVLCELDVDTIDPSPYQSKVVNQKSEHFIQELAANIYDDELTNPIVVRKKDCGRFEIITGEHRLESFKRNGTHKIPAFIRNFDDIAAAKSAVLDNIFRKNNSTFELWRGFKLLLEMGAYKTQAQLASKANISTTEMSRIMSCEKLSDEARELIAIDSHKFGGNTISTLAGMTGDYNDLVVAAIRKIVDDELDQKAALKWIDKQVQNKNSGSKDEKRQPLEFNDANGRKVLSVKIEEKSAVISLKEKVPDDFEVKLLQFLKDTFPQIIKN